MGHRDNVWDSLNIAVTILACVFILRTHMQIKACIKIFSDNRTISERQNNNHRAPPHLPPIHITHINDLNEEGCVIQLLNFSNKQQGYCVTNVDIPIKASLLWECISWNIFNTSVSCTGTDFTIHFRFNCKFNLIRYKRLFELTHSKIKQTAIFSHVVLNLYDFLWNTTFNIFSFHWTT